MTAAMQALALALVPSVAGNVVLGWVCLHRVRR